MRIAIISAGLLLCMAVAGLLVHRIRKKKGSAFRWVHVLWTMLIGILMIALIAAVYFAMYYHRDESADPYLESSESVTVAATENGLFFDGPSNRRAVIFYPGAKVEAEAYAPLLFRIAEEWGDCFLVEMPLNMAIMNVDAAQEIQQEYHYDQWFLAGHSLGGASAALYAEQNPDLVNGLILLAAYSTRPLPEDILCVSMYGDQDGVLNKTEYEKDRENLPSGTREVVIPGGNHAQFGNYGAQRGDGTAAITWEEQQNQVVETLKEMEK